MKFLAVFCAFLAVSTATAIPEKNSPGTRIIGDAIAAEIEKIIQTIREEGYDPYHLDHFGIGYALPVPILFDASSHIADLAVTGVSDIVIHDISYGLLTNRLSVDISLPRISVSLADSALDVTVLGKRVEAAANFNFAIVNTRVSGIIQMNVGIITGIFVRDVNLNFNLGRLEFHGNVEVAGFNLTPQITDFITSAIPYQISQLRNEINELVNLIVFEVADSLL